MYIIENYHSLQCHPYCLAIPAMSESEFQELKEDISGSGLLEPIVIFEGMILDGRHRFRACVELDIDPWFKEFDGPDSAKDYVVSKNLKRRNLTTGQKAMAWEKLCGLQRGSNQHKAVTVENEVVQIHTTINSAPENAGIGRQSVIEARKVRKQGAPEVIEAVETGRVAVSAAAKLVETIPDHEQQKAVIESTKDQPRKIVKIAQEMAAAKPAKTYITLTQWESQNQTEVEWPEQSKNTFNRQEETSEDSLGNIEWAKWSWNPVTGCKHDCSYCYARDIANRFFEQKFEPSLHPDRLWAPYNTKPPKSDKIEDRNVFSNSMSDLYGRWVPQEWIDAVFKAMADNPQWNFLTLTKFPKRAAELVYPKNVWIGTSVDLQVRVKAAEDAFERIECGVKWLSIEPMIQPLKFTKPELFDWVVIGGASKSNQTPAWTPPSSWIVRVAAQFLDANPDVKIYLKTNGRPREFPGSITAQSADEVFYYLGKKN